MSSTVYYQKFTDNGDIHKSIQKLGDLFSRTNFKNKIQKEDFVGIKMHFGEKGNTNHIAPPFVKKIAEGCQNGITYVTDTNTLYVSARSNAVSHLKLAASHGYSLDTLGVPVIIADGLASRNITNIPLPEGNHFKQIAIASDILNTDILIFLTHITGHLGVGFGGTLKNIAMGCAGRSGKQQMHSNTLPVVTKEHCTACGRCLLFCPEDAITISEGTAIINADTCVGCAECVVTCRFNAIAVSWSESTLPLQEKIAEYALGVIKNKRDKCLFFNFIVGVTKNCDCIGTSESNATDNLGIVASTDPVALDKATMDLINTHHKKDVFRELWPEIDATRQITYAAELGLGSLDYTIVEV